MKACGNFIDQNETKQKVNTMRYTPSHKRVKVLKDKYEEKVLKESTEKQFFKYKGLQ